MKKRWTRWLALLGAAVFLLAGCTPKGGNGQKNLRIELLTPRVRLTLATDQEVDEISMKGLQLFAEKMATLSGGELMVDIVTSDNPVELYTSGEAQLLFVPSRLLEEKSGEFAAYSSPFYFRSYDHMTMTLNSPTFQDLVEADYRELLGGRLLAAAYGGSSVFLSRSRYLSDIGDFDGLSLTTDEDEDENLVLREMGVNLVLAAEDQRIQGFNSGFYETISCPAQRLSEIYLAEDSRLYLADFFYDPTILWLFTSQELYDTMDDRLKMVLAESAAYLVGTIDEGRLAEIDTGREKLIQAGAEVTRISADSTRKKAKEILRASPAFANRWSWERFDTVQEIIR